MTNPDFPHRCTCPEVGVPCPACCAEKPQRTKAVVSVLAAARRAGGRKRWRAYLRRPAIRARLFAYEKELSVLQQVPHPYNRSGHHPHAKRIRQLRIQITRERQRLLGHRRTANRSAVPLVS